MPSLLQLPETPVDFRKYARSLLKTPDLADSLESAFRTHVKTHAIIGPHPAKAAPASMPDTEIQALIETGLRAAEKAAADPTVPLTPRQLGALEAVVRLTERPALLVRKDDFPTPPKRWERLDVTFRGEIRRRLPTVGRIDMANGGDRVMVGTAFVVGEDLLMTNRHVVKCFASPGPNGTWGLNAATNPRIDFKVEYDEPDRRVFAITDVPSVHPNLDLALLRVARQAIEPAGAPLPCPVALASSAPDTQTDVDLYAVGYPWVDNENKTPPEVIKEIYGDTFQVKRLQPGQFGCMFDGYGVFSHDCSTLGGNSGSPVIDLDTDSIIGLHSDGRYNVANYAVALWLLKSDPLFAGRGISFGA